MNKSKVLESIDKYKNLIIQDEKMMDESPNDMYWYDDYEINLSMLKSLEKQLITA